jgi:hypothetical protein
MPIDELIFISYASPDRDRVVPYYDALKARGYDVWMDFRRLKPGQNWDFEIKRALNRAVLIIVFVSNNSTDRRGYVQREIKIALDRAMEKLAGDIYLIPVLLDDEASIPDELKQIHIVHASDTDCVEKIEDAIRHQLQQLGANVAEAQGRSKVRWSSSSYRDNWDGLPGYEAEFKLLHFSSDQYPETGEVTEIIRGTLLSQVAEQRFAKFYQNSERYNFGQQRFSRTNTWEAFPAEPKIVGKVLSLQYSVHWYSCGAAHPNMGFLPFCFLLEPVIQIGELASLFVDRASSLEAVQNSVRQKLLSPSGNSENSSCLQEEWVQRGTDDWGCFRRFVFDEDGLQISFAPYEVAAYASGPQIVKLPYAEFKTLLVPWFRNALEVL